MEWSGEWYINLFKIILISVLFRTTQFQDNVHGTMIFSFARHREKSNKKLSLEGNRRRKQQTALQINTWCYKLIALTTCPNQCTWSNTYSYIQNTKYRSRKNHYKAHLRIAIIVEVQTVLNLPEHGTYIHTLTSQFHMEITLTLIFKYTTIYSFLHSPERPYDDTFISVYFQPAHMLHCLCTLDNIPVSSV